MDAISKKKIYLNTEKLQNDLQFNCHKVEVFQRYYKITLNEIATGIQKEIHKGTA